MGKAVGPGGGGNNGFPQHNQGKSSTHQIRETTTQRLSSPLNPPLNPPWHPRLKLPPMHISQPHLWHPHLMTPDIQQNFNIRVIWTKLNIRVNSKPANSQTTWKGEYGSLYSNKSIQSVLRKVHVREFSEISRRENNFAFSRLKQRCPHAFTSCLHVFHHHLNTYLHSFHVFKR